MMQDYLIRRATEAATKTAAEIASLELIANPKTLQDILKDRIYERSLEAIAPKTGYVNLDRVVTGFIPGHVYVVTGETNVGKTKLGTNFALQVAFQVKRVLYVALEPENMILEYIASVFHDKKFKELDEKDIDLEGLQIDVVGKKEIDSFDKLLEMIVILERYDLIIIDHIGYFITSSNNQIQEQSNAMKKLVGLAQEKKTAIMVIAHLRKKPVFAKKQYVPIADDIAGSGAFSRDATEVFIVTRNSYETEKGDVIYEDDGFLHVVKTKKGNNAKIPIRFCPGKATIIET